MKSHEEVLKEWNGGAFLSMTRKETIGFLHSKYNISDDDAEDVFQESAMALFMHIKNDELELEKSSLLSYFKRICILQTLKFLRDNKGRHDAIYEDDGNGNKYNNKVVRALEITRPKEDILYERDKSVMWHIVKQMTSPCKEILWAFYHEDKDLSEIAIQLNKDKNVVKVRKAQCLSKLKTRKHLFE